MFIINIRRNYVICNEQVPFKRGCSVLLYLTEFLLDACVYLTSNLLKKKGYKYQVMSSRYHIEVELNVSITSASITSAQVLSERDEMMFLSEQNKIKSSIS